jgi:hypothetical protein
MATLARPFPALSRSIIRPSRRRNSFRIPIRRCRRILRFRLVRPFRKTRRFAAQRITENQVSKMTSIATNLRFIGPKGNAATLVINGRAYSVAASASIDVPNMDAQVLAANNWGKIGDGSGTTAQRPATPHVGQTYVDTTLGYMVCWEGAAWRNPATAAVV